MAIDNRMTTQALVKAKLNVYNVCRQGSNVVLVRPGASKDEFGTPLSETILTLKSFPTRYNPYDRETMEKITWADNTDILCYISKHELDLIPMTIQSLRMKYKTFRHADKTYDIRYIEPYSAFANDFLYVVIGGKS